MVANRFVFWQASLPRRHLAVHVVVDVVPVHGVEGAAGDGEAVGGFVVDVCFFEVGAYCQLLIRSLYRRIMMPGWTRGRGNFLQPISDEPWQFLPDQVVTCM